jgi:predicted nucleotidyltransferase
MAETKIYISDAIDARLRELAMARFGYGRGSISAAVEEAIIQWIRTRGLIKKRLENIVDTAKGDAHVIAVLLFGSYPRKERDYKDIDVAILVDEKAEAFEELNKYTKIEVGGDSVPIDVSILNNLPISVQRRIMNEGFVLYSRNQDMLYDYSLKVAEKWDDYRGRFHIISEAHA